MEEIKISTTFTEDDIKKWDSDTKLVYIISCVLTISKDINTIRKTLYGNGEVGLCEKARRNEISMKWLWGAFGAVVTILTTAIIQHIFGK